VSDFDVIVIGGGPCGLAAAIAAHRRGFRTVVCEQGALVSSIAAYPTYATFFSSAAKIAIGGVPFACATERPTRRDALAYYRMVVDHTGIDVRTFTAVRAVHIAEQGFDVTVQTREGAVSWRAAAVVLATGYFGTPNYLGVPGESLPHVSHFYTEGHEAYGRDVLVVGGGNSAVEAALDLYRCGARVTVAHFGPTYDKNIKPWVRPDFEGRVAEGAIAMRWGTVVRAIETGRVMVETDGQQRELSADHVYLMTGYTPDPTLPAQLGVSVDPVTGIPAHDPLTMQTTVPGLFIAGVLASGVDANKIFIENGRDHGERIAAALAAAQRPLFTSSQRPPV
jgi:thioredoxin reductase (NADPH)